METVLKLFIEFLANVAILVLVPMLFVWLKDKIGEANAKRLTDIIIELVKAAEQLYPGLKTGDKKLEYVYERLADYGITEVDDELRAKIEAAVYDYT